MNNTTNLSSLIWSSADDVLRGLFKPSEYGRVILPFVVMRRLDCVLEPKKDEVFDLYEKYKTQLDPTPIIQKQLGLSFFNRSKYDLTRIKSDPTNTYINFNNYIQGYSSNVFEIIKNFQLDPLVEKLNDKNRLYQLIDKFTEFDLHPSVIDNHMMGSIYEELLRLFSEMSNEESGDHFTPRDIVKLVVSLVFGGDRDKLAGEGKIRSIYDPCCGTGGMLTIGKDWILKNINPNLKIDLYGQELNDTTYAICKSDLLMLGANSENIYGPYSSLSNDMLQGKKFDYMITNPPFGISYKSEEDFIKEEAKDPQGRFFAGVPRVSDSSLLFLQHLISKMNPNGSRIGIIFNSSPLVNGDAGQGESQIRKWVLENDLLETIVMLSDKMFFNTGIVTYIWILDNQKSSNRKKRVQLINASKHSKFIKKKLGAKNKEITDDQIVEIFDSYKTFTESDISKIFNVSDFGYTEITIERPISASNSKPDPKKRTTEKVPLKDSIENYFKTEIEPFAPDAWIDKNKSKIGYEINCTKIFYEIDLPKNLKNIIDNINNVEEDLQIITKEFLSNE